MTDAHIISIVAENHVGVLAHVAGMFASRGFNIDSIAAGPTHEEGRSRMTIVVPGDENVLEQVRKQLGKIIDVIKVNDFAGQDVVERDLMLIKVSAPPAKRSEIFDLTEVFRGKVVDIGSNYVMIELSGPKQTVEAMIELLRPYGIKEIARAGRIAMARGAK
jgi:acetolactate synthase-1/3 small subunit